MSLEIKALTSDSPQGWKASYLDSPEPRIQALIQEKLGLALCLGHIQVQGHNQQLLFEYDCPTLFETIGAVSIPFFTDNQNQVHIGFMHIDRPILNCSNDSYHQIKENALETNKLELIYQSNILGKKSMEIPRGMGEKVSNNILTAVQIAAKEVQEEMNIQNFNEIINLGRLHYNTTFSPIPVGVFGIQINQDLNQLIPQAEEGIQDIEFIALNTVNQLIAGDQITCAMTITAIKKLEVYLSNRTTVPVAETNTKKSLTEKLTQFMINLNPWS